MTTYSSTLGDSLQDLWEAQKSFNAQVRNRNIEPDIFWAKQYLLGLVSEVDEVLREINWKSHRANKTSIIRSNLAFELADLTKYVLSLWELWGFGLDDVLNTTLEKSWWVQYRSEMELEPGPTGRNVLITDLDGTLADWRRSFVVWMEKEHNIILPDDSSKSMMLDQDLAWKYTEYAQWKDEFESQGGYAHLIPYLDGVETVQHLQSFEDVYVVVYTARPEHQYKRIWWDTFTWLQRHNVKPDQLLIGADARVILAHALRQNNNVILFDDDPSLIMRAANSGIRVYARRHPYNSGISHSNITWVDDYLEHLDDYFKKES